MDEVELVNNHISSKYICRLSDFELVGMDGFFSTMYCSVDDSITGIACTDVEDTSVWRVADSSVGCIDRFLLGYISHIVRL